MWNWILDRFARPSLAAFEATALAEADARHIGKQGTRGTDDERDAFRHTYVAALLVQEYGTKSRWFFEMAGNQLELDTSLKQCPPNPRSAAMDITNNKSGLAYDPASAERPADYAHRLLKAGLLVTSPQDAPAIGWVQDAAMQTAQKCAAR